MGLLITFILGIFILIGVYVVKITKNNEGVEQLSISIALGTMFSLVLIELIPEVFETFKGSNLYKTWFTILGLVLLGVVLLKILDIFVPEHDHEHSLHHDCSEENLIHIGIVSSVAIILHNIIEGMAVYSMSLDSLKLSLLVALGVGLHNIPMGMVIYSTLKNESRKKRMILLTLVILSTFIGGLLMMCISGLLTETLIASLICITLGMLIYIIVFELLPHILHSKNKLLSLIGIIIGILVIIFSSMLE